MGFFDGVLGKSDAKRINASAQEAERRLAAGKASVRTEYGAGTDAALGRIDPYMRQGRQASDLYGNALGINGGEAQQGAYGTYSQSPFLAAQRGESENALTRMFRQYNARGLGNSGTNRLATARAAQGFEQSNQNSWLDRLNNQGQQGAQFAQTAAGLEQGRGQYMADLESGYGQQLASNEINRGNAVNAARQQGRQNLIGGLSTLAGAAMQGFGGGVNSLTRYMQPGTAANGGWSTTTTPASWWQR